MTNRSARRSTFAARKTRRVYYPYEAFYPGA